MEEYNLPPLDWQSLPYTCAQFILNYECICVYTCHLVGRLLGTWVVTRWHIVFHVPTTCHPLKKEDMRLWTMRFSSLQLINRWPYQTSIIVGGMVQSDLHWWSATVTIQAFVYLRYLPRIQTITESDFETATYCLSFLKCYWNFSLGKASVNDHYMRNDWCILEHYVCNYNS